MKLVITEEHIKTAISLINQERHYLWACVCPTALAWHDLGFSQHAIVLTRVSYCRKSARGRLHEFKHSTELEQAIHQFDLSLTMAPAEYELEEVVRVRVPEA